MNHSPEPRFPRRVRLGSPRRAAGTAALLLCVWPDAWAPVAGIILPPGTRRPPTAAELRETVRARGTGLAAGTAGWAAILTLPDAARLDMTGPGNDGNGPRDTFVLPGGQRRTIEDQARHALRLDADDAEWLFSTARTRTEAITALDRIDAGKPPRTPETRNKPREPQEPREP